MGQRELAVVVGLVNSFGRHFQKLHFFQITAVRLSDFATAAGDVKIADAAALIAIVDELTQMLPVIRLLMLLAIAMCSSSGQRGFLAVKAQDLSGLMNC